jgi:hypothetical protein
VRTLDAALDLLEDFDKKKLALHRRKMRAAAAKNPPQIRRVYPRPQVQPQHKPRQQPIPKLPPGYNAWSTATTRAQAKDAQPVIETATSPMPSEVTLTGVLDPSDKTGDTFAIMPTTTLALTSSPTSTSAPTMTLPSSADPKSTCHTIELLFQRVRELQVALNELATQSGVPVPKLSQPRLSEEQRQEIIQQMREELLQDFVREEAQERFHSASSQQKQRVPKKKQQKKAWRQVQTTQHLVQQNESPENTNQSGFGRQLETRGNFAQSRQASKQQSTYVRMEVSKFGLPTRVTTKSSAEVQQQTALNQHTETSHSHGIVDQQTSEEGTQHPCSDGTTPQNPISVDGAMSLNSTPTSLE